LGFAAFLLEGCASKEEGENLTQRRGERGGNAERETEIQEADPVNALGTQKTRLKDQRYREECEEGKRAA